MVVNQDRVGRRGLTDIKVGNLLGPNDLTGGGKPVPAGATGVVLNVTVANPTAGSFMTVYPGNAALPVASSLNYLPAEVATNQVITAVDGNGNVKIFNRYGSTDVIVDVAGYFSSAGNTFTPVVPKRALDSREVGGLIGQDGERVVDVAATLGVGAGSIDSVVLNVTATEPSASSYMTVFPDATTRPLASNLNYVVTETVPNHVTVKATNGKIKLYNFAGATHAIVDIAGYYGT